MKSSIGKRGFTLVEMTVVIMVLLTLLGTGLYVSQQYKTWQMGRSASEQLRTVYAAQRMYLADHPTAAIDTITAAELIPYLPNRATAIPTVESLEGTTLQILVAVSPPAINDGSGGVYDPSGPGDALWEVDP